MTSAPPLVLAGVNLLDGTGTPPCADAVVVIRGERISAVGRRGDVVLPEGVEPRELGGRWLVPGLIDAHVHVEDDAGLGELLRHGVTTARNPATTPLGLATLRARAGREGRPDVLCAGAPIDMPPGDWPHSELCRDAEQVRAAVRRQAAAGVDLLKLYVRLPRELVAAGIAEAHACGLPAAGDLAATSWTEAAQDGIDVLCHAVPRHPSLLGAGVREHYLRAVAARELPAARGFMQLCDLGGPEIANMLDALARARVTVEPTLGALHAIWFGSAGPGSEPEGRAWSNVLELVRRLRAAGIELLAGSDAPRPGVELGAGLHRELAWLCETGPSAGELLALATGRAAQARGIADDRGTIEPGKRADLVLLARSPLESIANLRAPCWTMKSGVIHPVAAP